MKTLFNCFRPIAKLGAALAFMLLLCSLPSFSQVKPVKNVVIVHGAFADGSGWKNVFNILSEKGYQVTIVQNPLTSLQDDVDATNRILDKQDGPVILVGHSWGGVVISQAGVHKNVTALVYVAAFQPDEGETTLKWATSMPNLPEFGILPPDDKGFLYYDKAKFHAGFCADVSKEEAAFMFASQGPVLAESLATPLTHAAWRTKRAYGIVATQDKSIRPEVQRNMYNRSKTKITEITGSHALFVSQPAAVANVIIEAAMGN
ncbi:alpha/beta hydrolase [Dyadobacter sp. LJ53]|uniref:alpha/beta hydrolase n=1 Tax=Dyadobacter chenwenxiniae TaxID=2906456 RepID=UPI001F3899B7|nr:alpha/beta hydrolase [Dyadobacter chenwenxiniae]MCF0051685.1 alpha/beta hydrolase [Dyadobacter chenwenxiniae]